MRILSMAYREYLHRHQAICEVKHKILAKHTHLTHVHSGFDSPFLLSALKLDIFMTCAKESKFSWIILVNSFRV
jgi:hypothetical protein